MSTRIPRVLVALASVAAFTGCQTTTLYRNDFEAEGLGQSPVQSPSGSPAGDETHVHPSPSPQYVYVTDAASAGPIEGKSLIVRDIQDGGSTRRVRFITTEFSDMTEKKRFNWTGRMSSNEPLYCHIAAAVLDASDPLPQTGAVATLELDGGTVSANVGANMQTLNNYTPGEAHHVSVVWDPQGQVSLALNDPQGSISTLSGAGSSAGVAAAKSANRLMLECLILDMPGIPPSGSYVMDNVRIRVDE